MSLPSRALTINLQYDSSVTSLSNAAQVEAAVNYAAQQFQNAFSNPITITIDIVAQSGVSVFGMSDTSLMGIYSYAQIKSALTSHATSANDNLAVANLPATDPTGGANFWVPQAEAQALGLDAANDPSVAGTFTFGSGNNFNYSTTNRAAAGQYDFVGVAEHEISEVLGRTFLLGTSLNSAPAYEPFDLYRWTNSTTRSLNQTDTGVYFSLNGSTNLKNFNVPGNGGDLQDWASAQGADAGNAFSSPGVMNDFTTVDQTAMDVMGYTLAVPEPASLATWTVGCAILLGGMRLRPRRGPRTL